MRSKAPGSKDCRLAPAWGSTPTVALENKPTAASYQTEGMLIRFASCLLRAQRDRVRKDVGRRREASPQLAVS